MSAATHAPPAGVTVGRAGAGGGEAGGPEQKSHKVRNRLLIAFGIYLAGLIALIAIYGFKGTRNNAYKPQNEFKLESWLSIHVGGIDFSLNKAVLYLVLAASLTCFTMIWVARRMQERPNKVQTAVEAIYQLMRDNITGSAMDDRMARKWFPFIGTLFLFILFSNLIGYLPLPTNTEHEFTLFGVHLPTFSLYAATANLAIPLVLALVVFTSYTAEGIRAKGPIGYLKGLVPGGVEGGIAVPIFFLEVLSNLMRILSLTIRLFANILAGHLIILFFAGALAVLLGVTWLGWFALPFGIILFAFEVSLVAALQAFIFATLTAIYLGGAVAAEH
ncbi:MAG TPA: F0F1 ATP synthase subunit A [Solirubrobacteraceae bacterium]|jgi:F-type H+-transporting ATPase subunit a|nr:F0F1 ATP synthase subunit A [Solirubrobacteraceae bacterium]